MPDAEPESGLPTPEELERVRRLYEQWLTEPDALTGYALVWQIPRLLALIAQLQKTA